MYAFDLGWASFSNAVSSSSDDAWVAYRLKQIVEGTPVDQLISRWKFTTQNAVGISYLKHLIIRVSSYAIFIYVDKIGTRVVDLLIDRTQFLIAKIKGTSSDYEKAKQMTQLFLTLAFAYERLELNEKLKSCDSRIARAARIKPIQENTIDWYLFGYARKKTLESLSSADLKVMFTAIQILPVCNFVSPKMQKVFVLEIIRRCDGTITLPNSMEFEGDEIKAFIETKCTIDLNGALFSNIPAEVEEALIKHDSTSKKKMIRN